METHLELCAVCRQLYDVEASARRLTGRCDACTPRPITENWSSEQLLIATIQTVPQLKRFLGKNPWIPSPRNTRAPRAAIKEIVQASAQIRKSADPYADIIAQKLGFPNAEAFCAYPDATLLLWDAFWGADGHRHRRLSLLHEPRRLFWGDDLILKEPYRPMRQLRYPGRPLQPEIEATKEDIIYYRRYRVALAKRLQIAYHTPIPQIMQTPQVP